MAEENGTMKLEEQEFMRIQVLTEAVNKARQKLEAQRTVLIEHDENFKEYFDALITQKGGNPENRYQLNPQTLELTLVPEAGVVEDAVEETSTLAQGEANTV